MDSIGPAIRTPRGQFAQPHSSRLRPAASGAAAAVPALSAAWMASSFSQAHGGANQIANVRAGDNEHQYRRRQQHPQHGAGFRRTWSRNSTASMWTSAFVGKYASKASSSSLQNHAQLGVACSRVVSGFSLEQLGHPWDLVRSPAVAER